MKVPKPHRMSTQKEHPMKTPPTPAKTPRKIGTPETLPAAHYPTPKSQPPPKKNTPRMIVMPQMKNLVFLSKTLKSPTKKPRMPIPKLWNTRTLIPWIWNTVNAQHSTNPQNFRQKASTEKTIVSWLLLSFKFHMMRLFRPRSPLTFIQLQSVDSL